ncbi:hypothetical protein BU204_35525 [Actinophytocola xanthii]|uniref:Sensor-like histidine kinase SenX3 n=1 Tax=Actinophytocola xanthii TaxID=1912961 RepID=A0A1Q8BZA1_9PSEU|nr:hypothetical protein BU204_35735 [Actinophytocola xanthii]OLF07456.1 hypothetical protein BU204_35525 [Actinophytocola xanthii]
MWTLVVAFCVLLLLTGVCAGFLLHGQGPTLTETSSGAAAVVVVLTVSALLGTLYLARYAIRSLLAPIQRLRVAVTRFQDGEPVVADGQDGAREVRELAGVVNELMRHTTQLAGDQEDTLRLHRLALEVVQGIRDSTSVRQAADVVCTVLGPVTGGDQLAICLTAGSGEPGYLARWHAPGLVAPPAELPPYVCGAAEELWRRSTHLALADTRVQSAEHEQWFTPVQDEAAARALLVVPIGFNERALGTISLSGSSPRRWGHSEIAVFHHVAAFLAQKIVEVEHREQQARYVMGLERLKRQRDDFLATVSHELRTPLTSISGYLEVLMDDEDDQVSDAHLRTLVIIERNTDRLRGLIEDLLAVSAIQNGRLLLQSQTVAVADLLGYAVEELGSMAQEKQVRLRAEAGPGDAELILGDRVHLQRAVVNIVGNALKFSRPGDVVNVSHAVDRQTGEIVISCADNGMGIPEGDLNHVTTHFFRASNATNHAVPGTGLGLPMVEAIVQAHRGALTIESTEGRGTTVTLRFPHTRAAVLASAGSSMDGRGRVP